MKNQRFSTSCDDQIEPSRITITCGPEYRRWIDDVLHSRFGEACSLEEAATDTFSVTICRSEEISSHDLSTFLGECDGLIESARLRSL